MSITAITLGGQNLNDGTYFSLVQTTDKTAFTDGWRDIQGQKIDTIDAVFGASEGVRGRPGPLNFMIRVNLVRYASAANRRLDYRTLKRYCGLGAASMDPLALVVTDEDYPEAVTLNVWVTGVTEINTETIGIECIAHDPVKWGALVAGGTVVTGTLPYTMTVTANGDIETPAYLAFNPGTFSGSTSYWANIWLWNPTDGAIPQCPVCVTFNHYTSVTGGTSLADGSDIAVFVNGTQRQRWIANASAGHTGTDPIADVTHPNINVWFYANLPAALTCTSTVAAANNTTPFTLTVDSAVGWPHKGKLKLDNEVMAYVKQSKTALLVKRRALPGTSAAAHVINSTVTYIPKHIRIRLGNDAFTQPTGAVRPAIDLTASTNAAWRWISPYISDTTRPWGWRKGKIQYSNFYAFKAQDAPTASFNQSGTAIMGLAKVTPGLDYVRHDAWKINLPFDGTALTGGTVTSKTSPDYVTFAIAAKEENLWRDIVAWPGTVDTSSAWGTLTWSNVTALTDTRTFAFRAIKVAGTDQNYAGEVKGLTIAFDANDQLQMYPTTPSFSTGKRYQVSATNSTTGESLTLETEDVTQTWTVIDGDDGEVYATETDPPVGGTATYITYDMDIGPDQMRWLTLVPGANTISWTSNKVLTAGLRCYYKPGYL